MYFSKHTYSSRTSTKLAYFVVSIDRDEDSRAKLGARTKVKKTHVHLVNFPACADLAL